MRRTDREVSDVNAILEIIGRCDVCHLALSSRNIPYIVPLNFGYEYVDGKLTLYFHCAKEGKKLDIIRENPMACFEMDCEHTFIKADEACSYSMDYESVIGTGRIRICESFEEKVKGLSLLMKTYVKDKEFSFPEHAVGAVCVLSLEVTEFTGKRKKAR